ncbi:MAG: slipin family protein [Calditrichota bacterium]|jgi:regulator of protease activity HflC (stomatin/prohibitin superfamily)
MIYLIVFIVLALILLTNAIRILKEYERAVMFRLGRLMPAKGPGIMFMIPIVDRMVRVSLRTVVIDVPPQDVITRDNVSIQVSAVIYFRVMIPEKAIVEVEDYRYATSQLSQTTLRSITGEVELDELLAQRDKINRQLQQIIDKQSAPWGIKISMVEIKYIDLPMEMKRTMARQAVAERERRSRIIRADAEYQAAMKLKMAAETIEEYPAAFQLRFLQSLQNVATEKNRTMIFPLPLELYQIVPALLERFFKPVNGN